MNAQTLHHLLDQSTSPITVAILSGMSSEDLPSEHRQYLVGLLRVLVAVLDPPTNVQTAFKQNQMVQEMEDAYGVEARGTMAAVRAACRMTACVSLRHVFPDIKNIKAVEITAKLLDILEEDDPLGPDALVLAYALSQIATDTSLEHLFNDVFAMVMTAGAYTESPPSWGAQHIVDNLDTYSTDPEAN